MILIAVLYAVFAAMTFINSKLMLGNPYPFFVGMLRALGSCGILFVYALVFHRKSLRNFSLPYHGWRNLIIFGVLVHGIAMSGFSFALQYTDPVKLCFLLAISPFVTAILQYLLYGEYLTRKKILGLTLGFLGLIPILLATDHGPFKDIAWHLELLGTVVSFVAVFAFAYGWIMMKEYLKEFAYPLEISNCIAMFIGGCVSGCLFAISWATESFTLTFTSDFAFLATAFVISSLATYTLYAYLLETFSPTFIAFAGFLEPVFGLFLGVLLVGHQVTYDSLGALAILFLGLYLFYKEELRISPAPTVIDETNGEFNQEDGGE